MSFDTLGLRPELLRAVREQEYDTPTPVQVQAIPAVLEGRDLMAAAQTGSGKTAGFTLPMLQRLMDSQPAQAAGPRRVRALVLVPTRELCAQVNESVRTYGVHLPLRSVQIFGGVGMQPQVDALRAGVDIVIATPGRLLDHVERRTLDLRHVEILVLDEADRMLDMGFIHAIRRILSLLPAKRQNLLFSATFADEIKVLADKLLDSPRMIEVTPRNRPVDSIEQQVFQVDSARKTDLLAHLFQSRDWHQVLVFTRTKHGANRLAEKLTKAGITAEAIHGNKSQNARTRALENFKAQKVRALVATDIAARGLDIDGLPQVVNFELPQVPEDYVHRIGRTGRAGADGCAVSLVARDEGQQWRAIERTIRRSIAPMPLPEFTALPVVALSVPDRGEDTRRAPQQRRSGPAPARRPADGRPAAGGGGAAAARGQGAGHRDGGRSVEGSRRDGGRSGAGRPAGDGRPGAGSRPSAERGAPPRGDRPDVNRTDGSRSDRPAIARGDAGVRRPEGASTERKRYFNGQVVFNSASPSRGGRGR